jgi:hypothetical protein
MFQTKVVQKIKTHILRQITFFDNRTVYEIMWKNTVQPDRPQITPWCRHFACWKLRLQTQTQNIFPLQQWLHGRASVLRTQRVLYALLTINRGYFLKLVGLYNAQGKMFPLQ